MGRKVSQRLLGFVILVGLLVFSCSSDSGDVDQTKTSSNKQASSKPCEKESPDIQVTTLKGNTFNMEQEEGKVILVDFWATWCKPCISSIPHLNKLYNKYKDQGFTIVGISLDQRKGRKQVKKVAEKLDIQYPVVMGTKKMARKFGRITAIPTAFIIDKSGCIREKTRGYKKASYYEKKISSLL